MRVLRLLGAYVRSNLPVPDKRLPDCEGIETLVLAVEP